MAKKAEPKKAVTKKPAVTKAPAATKAKAAPAAKAAATKAAAPAKMAIAPKAVATKAAPTKAAPKPAPQPVAAEVPKVAEVAAAPAPVVETHEGADAVRRRDFINIAAASFAGVGAVAIVIPLINQMNPSADVLAEASTEIDVSQIPAGQSIKTVFRKQPLFVRHLTTTEVDEMGKVDADALRDPQSLDQRTKVGKSQWLVTMGVCTHLGCVPLGAAQGELQGEYRGFFCPCHGSHYDAAGRIRKGPAPTNLEVPEYTFMSDTVIKVG